MAKPVIVLGGGGHSKVLIDILRKLDCRVLGIIDPNQAVGSLVHGFKVLGGDNAVFDYPPEEVELLNGMGSLPNDKGLRVRLFKAFSAEGYYFKTLIDPMAIVASDVELSTGVQVMAGVIIQAGTGIAENTIVNSGAIVDHDCRIGSHVHIAPGAVLSGAVEVGEAVHIGTGATVIQGIRIGGGSIIGAGSVITQSIDCNQIVYPARSLIKSISRDKV
ncbi:NeuD/PglB/VioB family sugar acetyltransferase [Candidatus Methylobacter oryzae]|uniref:Sugar acetyltransferase n=1 Tax=Candidatus Methylobacter oryzae TaxID=2497749 RepID=A0ABY3C975_9GAMM|nr:NeuD/PglB/VioB family sugar acetyltransferase [Candidatus Methylobacter oryzae]TRW92998.1 sugar acetyltransferase [Candidatus Methylobacter oryzae]